MINIFGHKPIKLQQKGKTPYSSSLRAVGEAIQDPAQLNLDCRGLRPRNDIWIKSVFYSTLVFTVISASIFSYSANNSFASTLPMGNTPANTAEITQIAALEIGKLVPIFQKIREMGIEGTLANGNPETIRKFKELQPILDRLAPGTMDSLSQLQNNVNGYAKLTFLTKDLAKNPEIEKINQIYALTQSVKNLGQAQDINGFMSAAQGLAGVLPGLSQTLPQIQQGMSLINQFAGALGGNQTQIAISKIESMSKPGGALTTALSGAGTVGLGGQSQSLSQILGELDEVDKILNETLLAADYDLFAGMDPLISNPEDIVGAMTSAQKEAMSKNNPTGQGGCQGVPAGQNSQTGQYTGSGSGATTAYLKGAATQFIQNGGVNGIVQQGLSAVSNAGVSGIGNTISGITGGLTQATGLLGSTGSQSNSYISAMTKGITGFTDAYGSVSSALGLSGGGSNGVPVIEQPGQLINWTGEIKDTNQKICEITQAILSVELNMWNKLTKTDPEQAKKSEDAFIATKKVIERQNNEDRKPLDNITGQGQNFYSPDTYLSQAINVGRAIYENALKGLSSLNYISPTAKDDMVLKFKQQSAIEQGGARAKYLAATTPTFDTYKWVTERTTNPLTFLNGLIKVAEPRNNVIGNLMLQNEARQVMLADYEKEAELKLKYSWLPEETCDVPVTTDDGRVVCEKSHITVPASIKSGTAQKLKDGLIENTLNSKLAGQDTLTLINQLPAENKIGQDAEYANWEEYNLANTEASPADNPGNIGAGGGGGGGSGGGNANTSKPLTLTEINTILNQLQGITGSDTHDQGGDSSELSEAPAINISMSKEDLGDSVRISWNADGAESCKAGNDWPNYLENNINGSITTPINSDLVTMDEMVITKPTLFTFKPYISGTDDRQINAPQPFNKTYSKEGDYLIETVTYKPNITGLISADIVFLNLNGKAVYITAGGEDDYISASDIVKRLITTLNDKGLSTDKVSEFAQYTIKQTYDSLVISKKTKISSTAIASIKGDPQSTAPIGLQTSYDYKITCSNAIGDTAESKITVDFFK